MHNIEIIIITIICSAFFAGVEIAFVTANKLKIEIDKNQGRFSARIISHLQKNPSDFIATLLVVNCFALVIYGIKMTELLTPAIVTILPENLNSTFLILIIQTIISSFLILITAEFLPKIVFKINANYMLSIFAIPIAAIHYLIYPLVFVIIFIAEFILKIVLGIKIVDKKHVFGNIDLDNYVKEFFQGDLNEHELGHEMQIFQNAIDFPTVKLRECMIPRPEICAIEDNDSITTLKHKFSETGLSKILIYKNSIDNIIGYAHSYDMFSNPLSIKSVLRPVIYVPETMLANKLLTLFIQQRKSIAVVVDEFGGTAGILTLEDVMEEIFGEINDEFDVENLPEKQISETEFIFPGRCEIDYLNEKYKLNLPESDDYETLAGLIVHHHQNIPVKNEEINIGSFIFIILQVNNTRIEQVQVKLNK
ncbi:MAG: HlyC/CorC family transporter [Bacteroidetes bacterium]|nr:HlyC/CorC family transporter [Bacteroidota bacterium]